MTGLQNHRQRHAYGACPDKEVCCLPPSPVLSDVTSDSDGDDDQNDQNGGGDGAGNVHDAETEQEEGRESGTDQDFVDPPLELVQTTPRYERGPASKSPLLKISSPQFDILELYSTIRCSRNKGGRNTAQTVGMVAVVVDQ